MYNLNPHKVQPIFRLSDIFHVTFKHGLKHSVHEQSNLIAGTINHMIEIRSNRTHMYNKCCRVNDEIRTQSALNKTQFITWLLLCFYKGQSYITFKNVIYFTTGYSNIRSYVWIIQNLKPNVIKIILAFYEIVISP